jgi:hypothetical protein|tara:strand:+ start:2525 stop:3424 length:900 start_codon:yes stop_codon:yes gene_type:complete
MSEAQVNDVELDLDDAEESSIDVEQPSTAEESTATPEVDLGYTDPVNNDKAEIVEEEKPQDNLQDVSEKTQKRIDKLTRRMRESERREKAALDYAKGLQDKYSNVEKNQVNSEETFLKEFDARVDAQREQAKIKLQEAVDTQDSAKMVEAQDELTSLAVEKEKGKIKLQETEQRRTQLEQQPEEAPVVQPSPKAKAWAEDNAWFGSDNVMTDAAFNLHKGLIENEGFTVDSDEYYNEINKRMRDYFPNKFVEDKKPVQTVASAGRKQQGRRTVKLTRSQVAIAKKLGVPLEEYAKFVKE